MDVFSALALLISAVCADEPICTKYVDRCVDKKIWTVREHLATAQDEIVFTLLAECVQERKDIGATSFNQKYGE